MNVKPWQTTETLAEMTDGIILSRYEKIAKTEGAAQSEAALEKKFIEDLQKQGYEYLPIHHEDELLENLRKQISRLNQAEFTDTEWDKIVRNYLLRASDGIIEKTRKIQEDSIYDLTREDGTLMNVKIIDKQNLANNKLQVINQYENEGTHKNRYDVTILVNGLPLVHVELKKRGVSIREAFNQINRYQKESFLANAGLFGFAQIFVISNGTFSRYFANTTERNKNNFDFSMQWADVKNNTIDDLEDFTATFFEPRTILSIITKYSVFNADNVLLIMRPYQIAAAERITWKIKSSLNSRKMSAPESGGYIWHTTGSGKTLTSFKAARLATEIPEITKVFFVVDRKDLDYQTMKEYQKFQPDSVNGSKNTGELARNIAKKDNKIIVTTIQKLSRYLSRKPESEIFAKNVVLIFDEAHRGQFGEAQKLITKSFKKYIQFGFTGTPIFPENSNGFATTASVFGPQLHSYVITDAIRDGKVLKFKIDYHNALAKFAEAETEQNPKNEKSLLLHPDRIREITETILKIYDEKTRRMSGATRAEKRKRGFNAMFAVQSVEAAKLYYSEFAKQMRELPDAKKMRVATIFSFAQNEEQMFGGEIPDENSDDTSGLNKSAKEFLDGAIADYNAEFGTSFSTGGDEFQNYYKDLAKKVKNREIDLIIVVGMFLTGFDAPTLNTLFVDKNLRYHGLIQAFSRTNRIFNDAKPFGNIVCFRDLEPATRSAVKLFGDEKSFNIITERKYSDWLDGFTDEETGKAKKGFRELVDEIREKFPDPNEIVGEENEKEFAKLFGQVLQAENILKNFDEFYSEEAEIISELEMQDMKSAYLEIREKARGRTRKDDENAIDFSEITFEDELLRQDEVNVDYILTLIFEKRNNFSRDEILRIIRSNVGMREREDLIMKFVDSIKVGEIKSQDEVFDKFYDFAKKERKSEEENLITEEKLKESAAREYIRKSLANNYASENGMDFESILPPMSKFGVSAEKNARTKMRIFEKIQEFVGKFSGI